MYIGLNNLGLNSLSRSFSPSNLFTAGEQGVWYDPSDLSTLYQDSLGVTPVTALTQPIGLMLDKRLGAIRGINAAPGDGLFATAAGWNAPAGTSVGSGVANFDGSAVTPIIGATVPPLVNGKTYEITFTVSRYVAGQVDITTDGGTWGTGVKTALGTYRVIATACNGTSLFVRAGLNFNGSVSNLSVREIPGNHAIQATAGSRPTLQQDASGNKHLLFDGVDDGLATAGNIDFTATNKMSAWAGVTKLSDVTGILYELSADESANNGSFNCYHTNVPNFALRATVAQELLSGASSSAPTTFIQTVRHDIAAATPQLRTIGTINAGAPAASLTGATTAVGNFGNYPVYIGRRGGTTFPFNGRLYGLIVRGALSTAAQIAATETYMGNKTGIIL